jgi:S1-C subfamily serine protease
MKSRLNTKVLTVVALFVVLTSCSLSSTTLGNPTPTSPPLPTPRPTRTPSEPVAIPTVFGEGQILAANLAELYQRVSPGVVTIWVFDSLGTTQDPDQPGGQGSGFVIDLDGHIVTNQHVITGVDQIEVHFPSGLKAWAELVGSDTDSDLAVLKVDVPEDDLVALVLGDSDQVRVGDFVVAIGNPFGLSGTMTIGIVSALERTLASLHAAPGGGFFTSGDIIQTDAAINPGNSGGPLINLRGEVIGVNQAIRTESYSVSGDSVSSGVGFAIPVNTVQQVISSIIEHGRYEYPYLGIVMMNEGLWNLKTLAALGLPPDAAGVYINQVTAGGPAEQAGLRGGDRQINGYVWAGGDMIIAIDGQPIRRNGDLLSYLINHTQVNQVITLTILRDGEEMDISLTIGARP